MRHYSIQATQKAVDHAALLFAIIEIETPRFVLSRQLNGQTKTPPSSQPAAVIYPLDAGDMTEGTVRQ